MAKSKTIIIIAVVVVLLGVATFFIVNSLNKQGTPATDTKTQDIVADAPEGCPKSTSIVVKSEEAGTQNISSVNSNFIHWRKDAGMLVFTNYTLDLEDVYADITGDRVLTVINLSHQDTTAMTIGTYRKSTAVGEASPNQYSSEYNISTAGLAGAVFDNNATVEITYFGPDYVCGTVTSNDESSSIIGQFIAKYIDKL